MIMLKGRVFFYVFRVCCVKWGPTSIEYRSNMEGELEESGTDYPSRTPEFTPRFLVGSVLLIFLVICVVVLCVFTF